MNAAHYRVRILPASRELEVLLRLDGLAAGPLRLEVPTWVPGAYGFMKYARDLYDVAATDAATGAALPLERDGWSGFTLQATPSIEVSYKAHASAGEWSELAGFVAHDQAVLLGTRYLRAAGHDGPCRVRYELPEGWAMHHPAGARDLGDSTWEYPSYAALLDTPVAAGAFERRTRRARGVDFHFVFLDRAVGFEREADRFLDAVMRVAEACHGVFGSWPFESYTVLCSFSPQARWGLEHANATMLGLGENVFLDPAAWFDAVRVAAHELFHAWNVCRLKPAPLGDPDLVLGSFPDALWVAEGFTRYYESLLCVRAGVMTPEDFFANLVNYHRHTTALPAYARVTLTDSSRATFLNHNRYPGSADNTIDYYDKGMLVAFDLDAAMRASRTSLDRELRAFYDAWAGKGAGFTTHDVKEFFGRRVPGIEDIVAREVERPGGLSTLAQLDRLGFTVTVAPLRALGLILDKNAGPTVANVLEGTPAGHSALASGDEILRLNGFPFSLAALKWLIAHEDQIALEIRRGHRYVSASLRPEERPDVTSLRWIGSEEQAAAIRDWLGAPFAPALGEELRLTAYHNFHGVQTVL